MAPMPPPQPPVDPVDGKSPYDAGPYAGTPYAGTPYEQSPYPGASHGGTPYGAGAYGGPPVHQSSPVNVADVVVTLVLLTVLGAFTLLGSFFGLFFGMASDGCYDDDACYDRVGVGVGLASGGPWVVLLLATVLALVLMVRRKLAFWVPLVAAVASIAVWLAGAAVAAGGAS
ncbi:DUF6264 family protein [Nocardioides alkalitolerans]|uniref:DUF6264 family protein n=1 Tax=Nocardioides alkalitolerans TaxID=281714 RepID=UPI00048BACCB|nr:DUF6264 family protein [Nocardioides alkalitolerans]